MNSGSKQNNYDTLNLMVRNPTTLFVHWSISERRINLIEEQFLYEWEKIRKILRLYDITSVNFNGHNAVKTVDIDVSENVNFTFLYNLQPSSSYIIDLGVLLDNNIFFSVLRSNKVVTPFSNSYQPVSNYRWTNNDSSMPEWLDYFSTYTCYSSEE
ncbi:DUF4912 domain-containing protein [Bacillus timonensis]|nr:DUF4912 domain-containing protein [Bacillus timonensis]